MRHFRTLPALSVVIVSLWLFLGSGVASAQQIAVKTNLLSWAAMTPDIGLELVTGENTSVGFSVFGHKNPYGLKSKLVVVQPEFRYWFNGRPLIREYIGIAAFAASYDMTISSHVYSGNAIGLGFSGGYVFSLGPRLGLELSAGTGIAVFRQKQYWVDDNYDAYFFGKTSTVNSKGYKLFPVKAAVTLIYIIR